jgi:hypothetical protein
MLWTIIVVLLILCCAFNSVASRFQPPRGWRADLLVVGSCPDNADY